MAKTYFTADLHFGDKKVMELDHRPFADLEEQDEELIRRWNAKVKDNDRVFILGDLSVYSEKKTMELVSRLNGHKHLLKGNHDKIESSQFLSLFVSVTDYKEINVDGRHVVLCHYPIAHWRGQRYGYVHLYGHTHKAEDAELFEAYKQQCIARGIRFYGYNAGCMLHNYEPMTIEELVEEYKEQRVENEEDTNE